MSEATQDMGRNKERFVKTLGQELKFYESKGPGDQKIGSSRKGTGYGWMSFLLKECVQASGG